MFTERSLNKPAAFSSLQQASGEANMPESNVHMVTERIRICFHTLIGIFENLSLEFKSEFKSAAFLKMI